MSFEWIHDEVKTAVGSFWKTRNGGSGVLAGKTLDPFIAIIERVVKESGLNNATTYTGKLTAQLPGFFRPHKTWDAVIIDEGELVAAIELKSQVGSIGNNFNNRSEEVLGSSIDLKTAIEELAFGDNTEIFTGYLIVVENSSNTTKTPKIEMKYFPVMEGFLFDESERGAKYSKQKDGTFPTTKGISYLHRYDVLCKRLMLKKLYTAAALVAAHDTEYSQGNYDNVSPETSIETFLLRLANHCQVIASIKQQKAK